MTRNFTKNFSWIFFLFFLIFTLGNNITLFAQNQNCNQPINLFTSNISNFSVELNWTQDPSVEKYRIRYKKIAATSWNYQHNISNLNNYSLTGLSSDTIYIWQLKAHCDLANTNNSTWSVMDTFITTNYTVDCNGDPNGTAFIDSCGNCVGGNTGNLECIAFSPNVVVTLSNTYCDSLSDLVISISQDPNEPDMSSSVCVSDTGYFDFTGLSTNDTIGSSAIVAGGGYINVTTTLMVDFVITSSKISVKAVDDSSGQIYGTFTLENLLPSGVLMVSTAPPDNNNVTSGNSQIVFLEKIFVNPGQSLLTFSTTINSELGDVDTQSFPFSIICTPVDCNGDPNGTAFIDSCGNCVGGNTGNVACIPFSPNVVVTLSNTDCDSLTDLTVSVSQDPNEPDISTSLFVSDGGSFAISMMSVGDTIGSAVMSANGGTINFTTVLIVSSILSNNQAIIQSQDINTGLVLGSFTISNTSPGVSILAQSVPDNNNVTSGNSSVVTFSNVFLNPSQSLLTFSTTINSELGDVDTQSFPFSIICTLVDCNGDPNGTAFIDSCGNCVGGNTGNVACIPFSPNVVVTLSNTDCDSLTDLTVSVSQDPNEPDISTSLFVSDGGSFAISMMSVGDTIGSAVMSANGGTINFTTVLIVSSILSNNQAIIQSQDINTGLVLGSFTISNTSPGVSILAQSVPDNNNVTSGNSSVVTFSNVFLNPGQSLLTFSTTINSELGDVDTQSFPFSIICTPVDCNGDPNGTAFIDSCGNCVGGNTGNVACIPFSPNVVVTLSNTDCDSLTDLTVSVSQDPNEPDMSTALFVSDGGSFAISMMSVGDTIGSAFMSANSGNNTFTTVLIVSSILSNNQAIIQSQDINTGLVLGSFTISNTSPGISIFSQSPIDNNNVTSGNSSVVTFSNVFLNPSQSLLTFSTTINSELGDVDTQSFPFSIICLCAPNDSSSSVTACDSYTWDGVVYTTSGTYSNIYTDVLGCDSVHTLNLTINNSNTGTSSATACDSYTWDGVVYTTSGTYSNTYTNAAGCDSVHTLNLTINNSTSSLVIDTACGSYAWSISGQVYNTSGIYVSTSINSLGCIQTDSLILSIICYDCNGDPNGTAFIDSCGNCVGGNTGNVACIPFSPNVVVTLSNTDCDSLTDLTVSVSQDPNEPDMSTALFVSDGGSFAISTMSVGDTIGSAFMSANSGNNTFTTVLIVSSILSNNQAIIQSQDINTGLVLGSFTISNTSPGISIFSQSPIDNNNVTSGNSSVVTFSNVFLNPSQSLLTFSTTINSELGDVDTQSFPFSIICLCAPNDSSSSVTACDSYTWDGVVYTTSGTYSNIYTDVLGCDSVHTLNLTINSSNTGTSSATACDSYTWDGVVYTTSGTYSNTYTNVQGCDSVHTLNLTINNSTSSSMIDTACGSYAWSISGQVYTTSGIYVSTSINSLGCIQTDSLILSIICYDCNGDPNGTAFIDSCGNCVGGNTGNVACIPFSPNVVVTLSNTDCDSLTDLTVSVSQDPNEPDMSTALFVSDGGSFAISMMSVGDTIGSAFMSANSGNNTFTTVLIVSSILSNNQAIIQSQDINTGLVLGSFTISNTSPGISIFSQSPIDNNNVTSGNSSVVTFSNVFLNPGQSLLTFSTTINSELGDVDTQSFPFSIICLCAPNDSSSSVTA